MNNLDSHEQGPDASKWKVRARCIQQGACPELAKGKLYWGWHAGHWTKVKVKRRLAGGVYWAECVCYPFNGDGTTVSANTYGGPAE